MVPPSVEALLESCHQPVRLYLASLGLDREAVDDIAQEVFLDLIMFKVEIPDGVAPLAWLKGMARNRAYNHFRRRRRTAAMMQELAALLDAETGATTPLWETTVLHLRACLEQLDPRRRDLVRLNYEEGLDAAAIAARVGRQVAAVHAAMYRIREALRRCIETRVNRDVVP